MLEKIKLAMRISTTVYDAEVLDLCAAAIADLKLCGPVFDAAPVTEEDKIVDYSVSDPLVVRAIITYCRMNFGSPSDFDKLKESYESQKGQMRESSAYGMTEA